MKYIIIHVNLQKATSKISIHHYGNGGIGSDEWPIIPFESLRRAACNLHDILFDTQVPKLKENSDLYNKVMFYRNDKFCEEHNGVDVEEITFDYEDEMDIYRIIAIN